MIASLMAYGLAVALVLTLAALCAELALAGFGRPRRIVWVLAMAGSLLLPALMAVATRASGSMPVRATALPALAANGVAGPGADEPRGSPLSPADPSHAAGRAAVHSAAGESLHWPVLPRLDAWLLSLWVSASSTLLAHLSWSWWRLWRTMRNWSVRDVCSRSVRVSVDVGPAVVGFLRPEIVLPRWLSDSQDLKCSMAVQHEVEHLLARDPLWLFLCRLLACAVPWNLPLWWQLQQLRRCVELDCDARVLRRGIVASNYVEMLLQIGQQRSRSTTGAVAMINSTFELEQRARVALAEKRPRRYSIGALLLGLSASMCLAAAQISAPDARSELTRPAVPAPVPAVQSAAQSPARAAAVPASRPREPGDITFERFASLVAQKSGRKISVEGDVGRDIYVSEADAANLGYDNFQLVARKNGLVAVQMDGVQRIVPVAGIRSYPIRTVDEKSSGVEDDEVVTRVVRVNYANASQLVPALRPMMPQWGHLGLLGDNALLLVDRYANIRRIESLIRILDVPAAAAATRPANAAP